MHEMEDATLHLLAPGISEIPTETTYFVDLPGSVDLDVDIWAEGPTSRRANGFVRRLERCLREPYL